MSRQQTAKPPIQSPPKTVGLVSLGCPKNLVDSEAMLGGLAVSGVVPTGAIDGAALEAMDQLDAETIVINTCGFLEASKLESLAAIRRAVELKSQGRCKRVVVAGCLAQRMGKKILAEIPEVDALVGVFDRERITDAVNAADSDDAHFLGKYHSNPRIGPDSARLRLTPRHFAYLRISEGCNQGCTFCTIPSIRGPMRSKQLGDILSEARELVADGARELNFIGQDTTSYGSDIGYGPGLSGFLRAVDTIDGLAWGRLMYAYPSCFTDEMIGALADSEKMVKYIDIPLQHIHDDMLSGMRRRVTRRQTEELLGKLHKRIPGLSIRTTFIVGFPGETDAHFEDLLEFVREFCFDMMGVFCYSPEAGTPARRMENQLPDIVKHQRRDELMRVQQQVAFAANRRRIGQQVTVMAESEGEGRHCGQAPEVDSICLIRNGAGIESGELFDGRVVDHDGYDLIVEPA